MPKAERAAPAKPPTETTELSHQAGGPAHPRVCPPPPPLRLGTAAAAALARRPAQLRIETQVLRPDGSEVWCRVTSVLFADKEGPMGYTSMEDITARKESDAQLERLYNAQETLLHLIAHDLTSPVAQVELLADLLERQLHAAQSPALAEPDTKHYLGLIHHPRARALGCTW